MKRPVLRAAVGIVALAVVALAPPGARGTAPAYRYVEADTLGSPGNDGVLSLATGKRLLVAGGYVNGGLPGQTHLGRSDAVIRVYSRGFEERWTKQIGTPGDDGTAAVATDGWVVVAGGWTEGDLGGPAPRPGQSGWVKAFRPDGTERWSRRFGSIVTGVAVTPEAIFVGGQARGNGKIKAYAHGGRLLWSVEMTSFLTPTITHLAAADGRVYYATGYTPIDSLHRTYVGSLDAETGESGWFELKSTDGDQITALAAADGRVYAGSTTSRGVTAFRANDGRRLWISDEVRIPHGERMRFATAIFPSDDGLVAAFVGDESSALVTLTRTGRNTDVQRIRKLWPTSVVRRSHSVFVGGETKADLDGPSAGRSDAVVARYTG